VMPMRYWMELPLQVIWFTGLVAGLHAWSSLQAARERELRAAQLEGSLARAQLRNLRLQLQPHFLFNALNTISATMYDDPRAADEMLAQLAELLRASLRTAQTDEVPLSEELAVLDCYLAILRARFGDRLAVTLEIEPGTAGALVPSMILQPLVENAVRHGNAERQGRGAVAVRARREGGRLILEVEDDGGGEGTAHPGTGVGLSATAERLCLLYGDAQTFSAGNGGGGFRVRATLPLRHAEAPA
jgi:two-component system, LytTR family, sensor kinase